MSGIDHLAIFGGEKTLDHPPRTVYAWSPEVARDLESVLTKGVLSEFYAGPNVRKFEEEFASHHGRAYGVATNSGTSAMHIAYEAMGVGPELRVVVPANCYISAATAALQLNAIPYFCDIAPETVNLDVGALLHAMPDRVGAIVPVHLYGFPARVDRLVAAITDVPIVEDCGQGHGAKLGGRLAGSFAPIATFSFYSIKHCTTGEGGMCLTDSADLAALMRSLCNKGKGSGWLDYERMGYSYAMTEMQAVVGLHSLRTMDEEVARRRSYGLRMRDRLMPFPVSLPREAADEQSSYFKFPLTLAAEFAALAPLFESALHAEGVPIARGYPLLNGIEWIRAKRCSAWSLTTLGRQACNRPEDTPVALSVIDRTFTLPTGPGIQQHDVELMLDAVVKVLTVMLDDQDAAMARWRSM